MPSTYFLCPHCEAAFPALDNGHIPTHDFPKPCRAVCQGSGKPPINAKVASIKLEPTGRKKPLRTKSTVRSIKGDAEKALSTLEKKTRELNKFLDELSQHDRMNFQALVNLPSAKEVISQMGAGRYRDMAIFALAVKESLPKCP